MTKATKQNRPDPQDFAEEGKGYTPCQMRSLKRIVGRIDKSERPAYQGAAGYSLLPGEG